MKAGKQFDLVKVGQDNQQYPRLLKQRLGNKAPASFDVIGNLEILRLHKTALLCSNRCPGGPILAALDQVKRWRDESRCIISGFHGHVEKECLHILLKGNSPLIICPARSIEAMRVPKEWERPLIDGRLLILSSFIPNFRRPTAILAQQRNEFVIAQADEIYIPWIAKDSHLEDLIYHIISWEIPPGTFR